MRRLHDELAKTGVTAPWKGVDVYSEDATDQAMNESSSLIAKAEKEVQELQQEWDVFFDSLIEKVEQQIKQYLDARLAQIFKDAAQQFKKNWNERLTTLIGTKLLEAESRHKGAIIANSPAMHELQEKARMSPPSDPSHRPPLRRR